MNEYDKASASEVGEYVARRGLLALIYGASVFGFFSLIGSERKEYNVPQVDLAAAKELIE